MSSTHTHLLTPQTMTRYGSGSSATGLRTVGWGGGGKFWAGGNMVLVNSRLRVYYSIFNIPFLTFVAHKTTEQFVISGRVRFPTSPILLAEGWEKITYVLIGDIYLPSVTLPFDIIWILIQYLLKQKEAWWCGRLRPDTSASFILHNHQFSRNYECCVLQESEQFYSTIKHPF